MEENYEALTEMGKKTFRYVPVDCSEMIICMVSWPEVQVPTHIMNIPLICYQEILKFLF